MNRTQTKNRIGGDRARVGHTTGFIRGFVSPITNRIWSSAYTFRRGRVNMRVSRVVTAGGRCTLSVACRWRG